MKIYLKPDDEVVADNVKLVMDENGNFVMPADSLDYSVRHVFDEATEEEYELQFDTSNDEPRAYYDRPDDYDFVSAQLNDWYDLDMIDEADLLLYYNKPYKQPTQTEKLYDSKPIGKADIV